MKRLTVWTIAVMTIIIACFSTVAALTNVEFFENDTSIESINFTWLNPPGEVFNHTTIWIPPYSCAWDSYINITGSNMSGANDSAYEVVLVTDLSWSMDDCLAEVEIRENLTYEEKFEQCDAFTDRFQEGEHSWKWNFYRGNWGLTFMNDEHISASTALGQSNHTYAQETAAIAEVRDLTFRNFTMEFMTLIYSGTGLLSERYVQVGFAKPMPTPANAYPLTGYTLRLTGDDHMQLFDGHDMVADEDMTGSIDTADYYQYKIIATDERILVYANDTWVIDVNTSPIINYTLSSDLVDGYISLATSQVYGIFDNIYIKSLEHRYNCTDHYGYASHLPTFNPSFRYSNITTIAAETPQCILPKIKNYTASSCDGLLGCEGPFCDEFENVTDITCGSRLQCSGPVCNVTTAQWTKNFSTTACTDLPPSLQIPSLCNATLDCNAALVRNQSAADCTGKWLCQGPVCDVPRAAWDKNYTANSCADIVVVNNGTFCDDRRYCDNTAFQNFTIPPGCLDMNNSILPACQPNNIGALPQHAGLMNISTQYWCDGTRELFNSTATSCAGLFDCAARCDNYIMNFTLDNCAGQPMCNMTAGCNGSISDIMNYTATDCSWFQTTITPDITYICNINVNYTSIIQNFTLPPVCPPDAVFCDTNYACNTSLFQDYGATDCSMYPGFPAFVNPSMCNGPICGTYTQNFTMNADCSQQYAPFCNDTLVCNVGLVNNYTTLDCSRYSPAPLTNVCDPSLTCGSYFKNFTTDLNCGGSFECDPTWRCETPTTNLYDTGCAGLTNCTTSSTGPVRNDTTALCSDVPSYLLPCTEHSDLEDTYQCSGPSPDACCSIPWGSPGSCCSGSNNCTIDSTQVFGTGLECNDVSFLANNYSSCYAEPTDAYCASYDVWREGTCAANEHTTPCVGSSCTDPLDFLGGASMCQQTAHSGVEIGYDHEDYMVLVNKPYAHVGIAGWSTVSGNLVPAGNTLTDTDGGAGLVNIPTGEIYTLFAEELEINYSCTDGARWGIMLYLEDQIYSDWVCVQGNGAENCHGSTGAGLNYVGTLSPAVICDGSSRSARINLNTSLGDKRITGIRIGDLNTSNATNIGKGITVNTFTIESGYTIPESYLISQCAPFAALSGPDDGNIVELCSGAGCSGAGVTRCTYFASNTGIACGSPGTNYNNTHRCQDIGDGNGPQYWTRTQFSIERDRTMWRDCNAPRYTANATIIENRTNYLMHNNSATATKSYCPDPYLWQCNMTTAHVLRCPEEDTYFEHCQNDTIYMDRCPLDQVYWTHSNITSQNIQHCNQSDIYFNHCDPNQFFHEHCAANHTYFTHCEPGTDYITHCPEDDYHIDHCNEPDVFYTHCPINQTVVQHCPTGKQYFLHCNETTQNFSTRSDYFSLNFNDSRWASLTDYIPDLYDYYRFSDGTNANDWGCQNCTRFYRKTFQLERNIGFNKPLSDVTTSCDDFATADKQFVNNDTSFEATHTDYYLDCGPGTDTLQIDLGSNQPVSRVKLWMYYKDRREYNLRIEVSTTSDFSGGNTLLWDYTTDGTYKETSEGHDFIPGAPVIARYVRVTSAGNTVNSDNHFVELEVFTPIAARADVSNSKISISADDGVICYINEEAIYYNPNANSVPDSAWTQTMFPGQYFLRPGENILACQVKNAGGTGGFNVQFSIDENTTLVHRASDFKFYQQTYLTASEIEHLNAPDRRNTPTYHTAEYAQRVDYCNDLYPYNESAMRDLQLAAWTFNDDSDDYYYGFSPVMQDLALMLGANITFLNKSIADPNLIPGTFWNADIIVIDGHSAALAAMYTNITNALWFNKTIIMDHYNAINFNQTIPLAWGLPIKNATESYDHKVETERYNNGTDQFGMLIIDQEIELSAGWANKSKTRLPKSKAANIFTSMFDVWHTSNKSTLAPFVSEYCLQGDFNPVEICEAEKMKLAISNDILFLNLSVRNNSNAYVGLVTFGTNSTCTAPFNLTTNATNLSNQIEVYRATCGQTCLSCAINESVQLLEPFALTEPSDNIVLMTDGLANVIINGTFNKSLARAEALDLACNISNPASAKARGITIHTVYYGSNTTSEGKNASMLLFNISNCTGGVSTSGENPDELRDAYVYIIGQLGMGYPKPKIKFGNVSTYDWINNRSKRLRTSVIWHNHTCPFPDAEYCNNLMSAINREVLKCQSTDFVAWNLTGCNITLNISSNRSGIVTLSDLDIEIINASTAPVAFPYSVPGWVQNDVEICPIDPFHCGNGFLEPLGGEECEEDYHCPTTSDGNETTCIPPGHGANSCLCAFDGTPGPSSLPGNDFGLCGDGTFDPTTEDCDGSASNPADWTGCYKPGSERKNCTFVPTWEDCGNSVVELGEECEADTDCLGTYGAPYQCIDPGLNESCTCIKPLYNIPSIGNVLEMNITLGANVPDIDLLEHAISPIFARNQLDWSIYPPTSGLSIVPDGPFGNGRYLQIIANGNMTVNITATDPRGQSGFFILRIFAEQQNLIPPLNPESKVLITHDKYIMNYYDSPTSGSMVEWGPYKMTVKVWADE